MQGPNILLICSAILLACGIFMSSLSTCAACPSKSQSLYHPPEFHSVELRMHVDFAAGFMLFRRSMMQPDFCNCPIAKGSFLRLAVQKSTLTMLIFNDPYPNRNHHKNMIKHLKLALDPFLHRTQCMIIKMVTFLESEGQCHWFFYLSIQVNTYCATQKLQIYKSIDAICNTLIETSLAN